MIGFGHVLAVVSALLPRCSFAVVPPVTSIRGLLKKQEVKTKAHSNVQLTVSCLPVSFQSLLPTNERLHAPTLPAGF